MENLESKSKIQNHEPFDSEKEFKNIRKLSKEEQGLKPEEQRSLQQERLLYFKENLIIQKEGIGKIISVLRSTIEKNPDATEEELVNIVKSLAPEYKFTDILVLFFEVCIYKYEKKHTAVEKYLKMYPDSDKLFEACFGEEPDGRVNISKSYASINFECESVNDIITIAKSGRDVQLSNLQIMSLFKTKGLYIPEVLVDELSGCIIALNLRALEHDNVFYDRQKVIEHEIQHVLNEMFVPSEISNVNNKWLKLSEFVSKNKESLSKEELVPLISDLIYGFVNKERKLEIKIDSFARDEILALCRSNMSIQNMYINLTQNSSYNYFQFKKEDIINGIPTKALEEFEKLDIEVDIPSVLYTIQEIFIKKYKEDLANWLNSIGALMKKGYGNTEIISLLYAEPVNSWPNLARRMKDKN